MSVKCMFVHMHTSCTAQRMTIPPETGRAFQTWRFGAFSASGGDGGGHVWPPERRMFWSTLRSCRRHVRRETPILASGGVWQPSGCLARHPGSKSRSDVCPCACARLTSGTRSFVHHRGPTWDLLATCSVFWDGSHSGNGSSWAHGTRHR